MIPTRVAARIACLTALVASMLANASLHASAQAPVQRPTSAPQGQGTAATVPYGQPQLTGFDAIVAFARLNGITPDFRPYAEWSSAYRTATTFDRPAVLAREIAQLEQFYRSFDLDHVYSMRLAIAVRQYEPDKGGFPTNFGDNSRIVLHGPVVSHDISLTFRNATDASLIPVADATAARVLAQRNAFDTQASDALSQAVLQMTYRLADSPPSIKGIDDLQLDVLRADILSARIVSLSGAVIYDFGTFAAASAPVARNADGTSQAPLLKSIDLQGFHVGMTAEEGDTLAKQGWKTSRGGAGSDVALYFNGMEAHSPDYANCANVTFGFPDQQTYFAGVSEETRYTDCLALRFPPGTEFRGDPAARKVVEVVTQQHMPGASLETLIAAVKGKYGTPLYTRKNSTIDGINLVWVGRDPQAKDAPPLQIEADARKSEDKREVLLTIREKVYVDARPKPVVAPTPVLAPKL